MTEELPARQVAGPEIKSRQLENLITRLPELSADGQAIMEVAAELIDSFALTDEFFENPIRNLFFLLLSQRVVQARISHNFTPAQRVAEEGFVHMAMPLLALDKSAEYPRAREQIDTNPLPPAEVQKEVYEEYTNSELTEELRLAIESGLLDDVKQRMGINGETKPFELRVLEIGDVYTVSGMEPKRPDSEYTYPPSSDWQNYEVQYQKYKVGLQQLMANSESFSRELGQRPEVLPPAWIVNMDGEIYLGIPSPVAQKILHPEHYDIDVYDPAQRARDLATLEHEFVHTQSPLMLDGEPFFGIALEERRAEYFSGDKMGYQDIKQMVIDITNVTGFDIKGWLEAHKQSERIDAYVDLVNSLGSQTVLEIALTVPQSYQMESRPLQKRLVDYLGTPDGLLKRLYEQTTAKGEEAEINGRVDATVKNWMDNGVDIPLIADIRPGMFGLQFMTDKYLQRYRELTAK